MPYKSMKDQIEANKRYRGKIKITIQKLREDTQILKNHAGYLELEVERLNTIIERLI